MDKKIEPLSIYKDFGDLFWEPDGYDMQQLPAASNDNFVVLVDKLNEVIETINGEDS